MVSRRGWLFVLGGIGVSGGAYVTNDRVKQTVDDTVSKTADTDVSTIAGPPPTENKIGEATARTVQRVNTQGEIEEQAEGLILRVEFFESGAAVIYPKAEHGCYDGFTLVHEATSMGYDSDGTRDTSNALGVWEFGDFDEPITIDMAGAIAEKGNYPSRQFEIRAISTDGACIATNTPFEMTVPEPMMPT
ncbi:hypothetical protein KM295_16430 [Natronomonas sp. F2-12]|jgi:hypothetical protein|uniref:Uncharacterized protein n=1 Tax=Natronomonas aquatica TaxID=2841590 RepID=A0A9R1CWI8_9EURY|nr:hypothetical protein [Natronomonas aquatica]MCQ4335037.1 hypothetical protein [Natronomonas aquatica]